MASKASKVIRICERWEIITIKGMATQIGNRERGIEVIDITSGKVLVSVYKTEAYYY